MGFEANEVYVCNVHENKKNRMIENVSIQLSCKDDLLEAEKTRLEQAEAKLESLRVAAEEEKDRHRSMIQVGIESENEVRTAAKELSQTLNDVERQLTAVSNAKNVAIKRVAKANGRNHRVEVYSRPKYEPSWRSIWQIVSRSSVNHEWVAAVVLASGQAK